MRKRIDARLVDEAILAFFGRAGLRGRDLTESHLLLSQQRREDGCDDQDTTQPMDDQDGPAKTQGSLVHWPMHGHHHSPHMFV
jgi:hypothetical protein